MPNRRQRRRRAAALGGVAMAAKKRRDERDAQQQPDGPPQAQPSEPTQSGAGGLSAEAIEKLKELGELHEQNVLTDEEFEREKAKLLGGSIPNSPLIAGLCPCPAQRPAGELSKRDAAECPGDHVAGIVDAGVDAGVGDGGCERTQRDRRTRQHVADPGCEGERRGAVSGGKRTRAGHRHLTCGRTPAGSGRRRRAASLKPRLTTVAVTASEASPLPAARRPVGPPNSDSAPAAASESFE